MNYSPQSEIPLRTVGEPRVLTPTEALAWHKSLNVLLPGQTLRHPRGVFKFKTYEEFNEWKMKHHL
jgi:hypothetical protein